MSIVDVSGWLVQAPVETSSVFVDGENRRMRYYTRHMILDKSDGIKHIASKYPGGVCDTDLYGEYDGIIEDMVASSQLTCIRNTYTNERVFFWRKPQKTTSPTNRRVVVNRQFKRMLRK